jgi:hypothetical protein
MKNISITAREKDFRPAYVFDDVKNLKMDAIHIVEEKQGPKIILKDVQNHKLSVEKEMLKIID